MLDNMYLTCIICLMLTNGYIFPLAPDDYTFTQQNIMFNTNNIGMMMCITVPIENDDICEGDETFQVVLSDNDPNTVTVAPALATVTITDDDGRYFDMHSHKLALF